MNVFLNKFNIVIDKFQINSVESSEVNVDAALLSNFSKLRNQLIYQKDLYIHYIGHKARLTHESKRREINQRRCM